MLVSTTDFNIDINIPNTDETPIMNRLNGFIGIYEPEYLTMLLGESLYADFKAGLELDPIPAKWQSLKDNIKVYQIAVYVYRAWLRASASSTSGFNVKVKPKAENADVVSPIDDIVYNWNRMAYLSRQTVKFIQENNSDYGNYYDDRLLYDYYYGCHKSTIGDNIFNVQNSLGL